MKHVQTRIVPAKTESFVVKMTCDICGNEIVHEPFNAEQTTVEHVVGKSYPEGGSGSKISFDICGKCFETKIVPWMQSQGAAAEWREWSW